jgi:ubiquinone/menaquinone biosynthesis C-methylase UbiE
MKTTAGAAIAIPAHADADVFDRWARVYDTHSNPLLLLEERKATPLLTPIAGGHVLDVGCGTGRWLTQLEAMAPASITGIDCSTAMLGRAREKVLSTTKLALADCSILPGKDASYTLAMASFVLSYIEDLRGFARECSRILQSDGLIVISDMHPGTAAERGWTRSFRVDGERVDIAIHSRSLAEVIEIFELQGFVMRVLIEPSFEEPEKFLFEGAGKLAEYEELAGVPAIYILKLQKRGPRRAFMSATHGRPLRLTHARIAINADSWEDRDIQIDEGRINALHEKGDGTARTLDLSGYSILPGLVNAHDHLEFGLFPRLGRAYGANPFQNSPEWAREIHSVHTSIIERYRQIPQNTHLWWGGIRNLLCGVTTVCHHNPLHEELTDPNFPVRVLSRFGWAHSSMRPRVSMKKAEKNSASLTEYMY